MLELKTSKYVDYDVLDRIEKIVAEKNALVAVSPHRSDYVDTKKINDGTLTKDEFNNWNAKYQTAVDEFNKKINKLDNDIRNLLFHDHLKITEPAVTELLMGMARSVAIGYGPEMFTEGDVAYHVMKFAYLMDLGSYKG